MQTTENLTELLPQLTLEEKIKMIHAAGLFRTDGIERLGIPGLHMSDGQTASGRNLRTTPGRP